MILLALAMLLGGLGCARTTVTDGLVLDHEPGDISAEMDYWHKLADRPLTTNNEALHGLIVFAEGADPNKSYEDRVAWLQERGHLPGGFDGAADEAAERGRIAQVLAGIMDVKGGLTMRVLGPHPRYALRELVHLEIMKPGSAQQGLPGIEFVGIISRAETYLETGT